MNPNYSTSCAALDTSSFRVPFAYNVTSTVHPTIWACYMNPCFLKLFTCYLGISPYVSQQALSLLFCCIIIGLFHIVNGIISTHSFLNPYFHIFVMFSLLNLKLSLYLILFLSDEDITLLRERFDRVYFSKRRNAILWF